MKTWILTLVSVGALCGINAFASASSTNPAFLLNDMQLDVVSAGSVDADVIHVDTSVTILGVEMLGDVIHVDTSVTILGVEMLNVWAAVLATVANTNASTSTSTNSSIQTSGDASLQVSESISVSSSPQ